MAKRMKRSKAQQRKRRIARGMPHKSSKSARGKATERTAARIKPKRAAVKKAARKKVQRTKQPTPAVETTVVDVIEEPAPGVITITEFEETEVPEVSPRRGEPEDC
jgi:hypothetical protein